MIRFGMNDPKPVRTVRAAKAPPERREISPEEAKNMDRPWSPIIESVLSVDLKAAHLELENALQESDPRGASELIDAINRAESRAYLASKLKNRARREYELFKCTHEEWLEAKKTAALQVLEQEKKEGRLSKQITKDMIADAARASWPDEFRQQERRLFDFQAAVHTLEDLAEIWRRRTYSLANLKDLVLAVQPLRFQKRED